MEYRWCHHIFYNILQNQKSKICNYKMLWHRIWLRNRDNHSQLKIHIQVSWQSYLVFRPGRRWTDRLWTVDLKQFWLILQQLFSSRINKMLRWFHQLTIRKGTHPQEKNPNYRSLKSHLKALWYNPMNESHVWLPLDIPILCSCKLGLWTSCLDHQQSQSEWRRSQQLVWLWKQSIC